MAAEAVSEKIYRSFTPYYHHLSKVTDNNTKLIYMRVVWSNRKGESREIEYCRDISPTSKEAKHQLAELIYIISLTYKGFGEVFPCSGPDTFYCSVAFPEKRTGRFRFVTCHSWTLNKIISFVDRLKSDFKIPNHSLSAAERILKGYEKEMEQMGATIPRSKDGVLPSSMAHQAAAK